MASNGRSRNGETTVGGAAEVEDHVVDGTGILSRHGAVGLVWTTGCKVKSEFICLVEDLLNDEQDIKMTAVRSWSR